MRNKYILTLLFFFIFNIGYSQEYQEANPDSFFTPNWLSLIVTVLLAAVVVSIIYFKTNNLNKRINRHRTELDKIINNSSKKENNSYELGIIEIKRKLNNIEQNISDYNAALSKLQSDVSTLSTPPVVKANSIIAPIVKIKGREGGIGRKEANNTQSLCKYSK